MAALRLHPDGGAALPIESAHVASPLGRVPHQIRGSMAEFSVMLLSGHAFDKCTACSTVVLDAFKADPSAFLDGALNTPQFLEDLSGLTLLQV